MYDNYKIIELDLASPTTLALEQQNQVKAFVNYLTQTQIMRVKKNTWSFFPVVTTTNAPNPEDIKLSCKQTLRQRQDEQGHYYFHIMRNDKEKLAGKGGFGTVIRSDYMIYLDAEKNNALIIAFAPWVEKRQIFSAKQEKAIREKKAQQEFAYSKLLLGDCAVGGLLFYQSKNNSAKASYLMLNKGQHLQLSYQTHSPLSSRLLLLLQIIAQVKNLHAQGYAHGDIKPHNIVYDPKVGQATLIDAGKMCKKTTEKIRSGTALFMSVEMQTRKTNLELEDRWTLGLTALCYILGWNDAALKNWLYARSLGVNPLCNIAKTRLGKTLTKILVKNILMCPPEQRASSAQFLTAWENLVKACYYRYRQSELAGLNDSLSHANTVLTEAIGKWQTADPHDSKVTFFAGISTTLKALQQEIAGMQENLNQINKEILARNDNDLIQYSQILLKNAEVFHEKLKNLYQSLKQAPYYQKKAPGQATLRSVLSLFGGFWSGPKIEEIAAQALQCSNLKF